MACVEQVGKRMWNHGSALKDWFGLERNNKLAHLNRCGQVGGSSIIGSKHLLAAVECITVQHVRAAAWAGARRRPPAALTAPGA